MYEITLKALKTANNERLWFNTNIKLGKLYIELQDYYSLTKLVAELHKSCVDEKGKEDPSKATSLLDIYCLEIQVCFASDACNGSGSNTKFIHLNGLALYGYEK